MNRMRADMLLVARGLAQSRAKAQAAIEAGGVRANGAVVRKASEMLRKDAVLAVEPAHPWVSRGGVKLAAALDAFAIDPKGRVCMDVGASTGGFTHVLLTRGAAKVFAVDVGKGQLHHSLAADQRVINLEQRDARSLTCELVPEPPSLIVCDVSFIGAVKALARPLSLATEHADLVVLIKPQFEAGPRASKSGVLERDVARAAAQNVVRELDGLEGFRIKAVIDSPTRGGDGNLEMLAHAKR